MRPLLLAAAVLAAPAFAQSQFVAEPGPYVSLHDVDVLRGGDGEVVLDAEAGWRFGNGLDVGLGLDLGHTAFQSVYDTDRGGTQRRLGVSVQGGYVRALSSRVGLRLGVEGGLQQTDNDRAPYTVTYVDGRLAEVRTQTNAVNVGYAGLSASAYVRVPVAGTVALQPTLGVYTRGTVWATTGGAFSLRADTGTSRADGELGPEVALPVTFRAFGTALAVDPAVRLAMANQGRSVVDAALRLRANF